MTVPELRLYITSVLDADSPYYGQPGKGALPLADRLAIGMNDPAFVWNVTASHHRAGRKQAYKATQYFVWASGQMEGHPHLWELAEVAALIDPRLTARREILEALLLCPDLSLADIAKHVGLTEFVVDVYQGWFFAVRKRMDDHLYIQHIVYPKGRLASLDDGGETNGQRLKRIAYEQGSDAVLRITGLVKRPAEPLSNDKLASEVERRLLQDANDALLAGKGNQSDVPALDRALKLVVARAKNEPAAPDEIAFNPFNLGDRNLTVGILKAVIEMEPGYTQDRLGWSEAQKEAEIDRQVKDAVAQAPKE